LEAAQFLVDRYNLELPKELDNIENNNKGLKKKYFDICRITASWCYENLLKSPQILKYMENRGISLSSIKKYQIGYFPPYHNKHNFILQDLIDSQILSKGKSVIYSGFEDRIIFPIKDGIGRFCGFGGRIYKLSDERVKYYNSRDSYLFSKGSLLFGLDIAKKSIQEKGSVFLVEGYTDCITMVQYGFGNCVATLGTACTEEHLKLLFRYAPLVYVAYDGDEAGKKAIIRLAEVCWKVSLDLRVIKIPKGEDPASYLTKNGDLKRLVDNSQDIFSFFIDTIGEDFVQKSLSGKMSSIKKLLDVIKKIDDSLKQDILLQDASRIFDMPFNSLKNELNNITELNTNEPKNNYFLSKISKLEKKILYAIINNVNLLNKENEPFLLDYLSEDSKKVLLKVNNLKGILDGDLVLDKILENCNNEEKTLINEVIFGDEPIDGDLNFDYLLQAFQKKNWKMFVNNMKSMFEEAKRNNDVQKVKEILNEFSRLKKKLLGKGIK
jgi:DNA primase